MHCAHESRLPWHNCSLKYLATCLHSRGVALHLDWVPCLSTVGYAGYRITACAATDDQCAFVLSQPRKILPDETQETLRTSQFPSQHVKVKLAWVEWSHLLLLSLQVYDVDTFGSCSEKHMLPVSGMFSYCLVAGKVGERVVHCLCMLWTNSQLMCDSILSHLNLVVIS